MKAILVAGTASGVGKTTVSLALMAGLCKRGLRVQPFKCGPDFIDTSHHTRVAGRVSRNLDTWMFDASQNRAAFLQGTADADVAVVEGMMGLFDGVSGASETGSSAEIAKLLGIPVLLVTDASRASRSVAATLLGFRQFDPEVRMAGAVLNGVGGEEHFRLLKEAIEATGAVPLTGWLPHRIDIEIPERHLGLHMAHEQRWSGATIEALAELAERHLQLDRLLRSMAEIAVAADAGTKTFSSAAVRIGVARDDAFQFYYEDNLDLLRRCGAEIVTFDSLRDPRLPDALDALYLGGGYPELHAGELSRNRALLADIRQFAQAGNPVYAECGGLMYLGRELKVAASSYGMAGVLPLAFEMTDRLVKFGYAEVEFTRDCLLGKKGTLVRGHSFHHSRMVPAEPLQTAYRVHYSLSGADEAEGYMQDNLLASYVHLHFRAHQGLAPSFVESARRHRARKQSGDPGSTREAIDSWFSFYSA
jgi:cobyrinic acid a,c-diamide synthase